MNENRTLLVVLVVLAALAIAVFAAYRLNGGGRTVAGSGSGAGGSDLPYERERNDMGRGMDRGSDQPARDLGTRSSTR